MDLQELEETAALARLNLGREELEAARPAFEQMLGFFAVMQEADNDGGLFPREAGVPGDADLHSGQAAGARLVGADHFRADHQTNHGMGEASGEGLLENAGERDGRFIVIPNVL
jgi:aspartyl-tRNA(Asn)/glutamyl-tRNA(Gln) amidotransferase subunit C